jgi:two-component system, chemotaxis family, chemotaxis protein CheY
VPNHQPNRAIASHAMIDLSDLNVLCVDDDAVIRSIVRSALRRHGCQNIVQAHGGEAALELCRGREFDLVICDFQMYPMTGLEFLHAMARAGHGAGWPVIMLSAETDPAVIQEARELGVCAWIGKPISVQTLIERIAAVLRPGAARRADPAWRSEAERQHARLMTELIGLEDAVRGFALKPRDAVAIGRALRGSLDEIGGHSRALGFELVSTLAERARDLLADSRDPVTAARQHAQVARALGTLVTAMKRVATNRMAGDRGEAGLRLLEKVDEIVRPVRAALE